ncbi:MAG: protein-methionine-sulfoxide reductase heme-binding subunit MsrQ [Anaerolineae bacterium]|nr:sulfoxide reductase heme-binding subunit YedZ [Candidatus Roseilinea sp.]MDW8449343.1 protein-methionine-sulfoxide reductase heme-binding subunit MsrQ [Anaerolineae bacterium]
MSAQPVKSAAKKPATLFDKLKAQVSQPLSWVVAAACLAPLAVLIYQTVTDNATANPIRYLTIQTGKIALILLVLSLACTPIVTLTNWKTATKLKRPLGLYGFLYVCAHLGVFTFDNGLLDGAIDVGAVFSAIVEKRFAIAGFLAFCLLVPLAITSTKGWQKRLGKRWKNLHKLAYVIAPIAVLHFAWLVKSIIVRPEPIAWGVVVALLLIARIPRVRKAIVDFRTRYVRFGSAPRAAR